MDNTYVPVVSEDNNRQFPLWREDAGLIKQIDDVCQQN